MHEIAGRLINKRMSFTIRRSSVEQPTLLNDSFSKQPTLVSKASSAEQPTLVSKAGSAEQPTLPPPTDDSFSKEPTLVSKASSAEQPTLPPPVDVDDVFL